MLLIAHVYSSVLLYLSHYVVIIIKLNSAFTNVTVRSDHKRIWLSRVTNVARSWCLSASVFRFVFGNYASKQAIVHILHFSEFRSSKFLNSVKARLESGVPQQRFLKGLHHTFEISCF